MDKKSLQMPASIQWCVLCHDFRIPLAERGINWIMVLLRLVTLLAAKTQAPLKPTNNPFHIQINKGLRTKICNQK